ncbi:hydrogen gas-evolving membrane-bound hydrogenase subunit E [Nesterenkonia sandarakina]|uniref:Multicomponent Na+:H+ antiporter subunit A n=1 Tax=Nesterenkonia sandarakina TaxID=272918 RepID=A0A7Z0J4I1_9MICC|nr:hydrogen gas-evolving membrane-bound hydrogenase subunit E [Nesterenkonia sandarakina]NYJ18096.1 multicomponent Na+:H+ antiporter subunit A [Nesterenkonia sandarakina]
MTLMTSLLVMLVAVALARPLAARMGRNAGYPMALLFLASLGFILRDAHQVFNGDVVTGEWTWIPTFDIALRLHLDGLSLIFTILVLGVGALIMVYCTHYLSDEYDHGRLYMLLAMFATAMLGMVLSADIVLLFVFFEITTLCSFFLIGAQGLHEARPATRAFVITASGGLGLLAAVVLLWSVTGTTDLTQILARSEEVSASAAAPWIGGLIIFAAVTKSAQFPFHFWLPDAMVALTPVSAYLHAATLVKAGIYVLMRFSQPFTDFMWWTVTLVLIGLVTTVFGAVFALKQHDLKALLAYSTVSQLGWIVALIGVGTPAALAVAGLHTFSHALFKATLFMLVGVIDKEAGSRDIRELSGLYRVMPVTATLTGLAALSMAGLPPFLGFVSKEEAYYAFLELPGVWGWVAGLTAVTSAAVTFAYGFRIWSGAFGGVTVQKNLYEPRWAFLAPAAVPALGGLVLGIFVVYLNPLFDRSAQATVLDANASAGLSLWPDSFASPALWMSVATVCLGLTLYAFKDPVDTVLQRLYLPISGVAAYDACYTGILRFSELVSRPARTGVLANHLLWPLGSLVLLAVGVLFAGDIQGAPPAATSRPEDWVVVALTALAALGLCWTRSRLGAVAMLGVIGFLMAGWFMLLGGVDLAMTQLLVEILTVAVAVLVLRRLPVLFTPAPGLRRWGGLLAASVLGVTAGAGTWLLTGRREPSAAAEFFVAEAEELAGGTNLVNTILVDFRGLDTFGEITVLAVAAVGLLALLRGESPANERTASMDLPGDRTVLTTATRILVPLIGLVSIWLLWRGHYEPGGGFVAALVASLALVMARLPRHAADPPPIRPAILLSSGLIVAVVGGLVGLIEGSFLRPIQGAVEVGGFTQSLTTSLIFDLGVFFAVLGLVAAALDRLTRGAVPPLEEHHVSSATDKEHRATRREGVSR